MIDLPLNPWKVKLRSDRKKGKFGQKLLKAKTGFKQLVSSHANFSPWLK